MEKVKNEKQNRFKSWALWLSVIGAVWTILNAFGLPEQWGLTDDAFKTIVDCVGSILIVFGIVNNPTDRENF